MLANIVGLFRFRGLINVEVGNVLKSYGWRVQYTKNRKLVLIVKGRLVLRCTFDVEGPALVTCNLWVIPDPAIAEPELEAVSIPGCEWYGPFDLDVVHAFMLDSYPPSRERRVAETWRDVKRIVRDIRDVILRHVVKISELSPESLKALAAYDHRVNTDYHVATLLEIVGPELASQWRDKTPDEIKALYQHWLDRRRAGTSESDGRQEERY